MSISYFIAQLVGLSSASQFSPMVISSLSILSVVAVVLSVNSLLFLVLGAGTCKSRRQIVLGAIAAVFIITLFVLVLMGGTYVCMHLWTDSWKFVNESIRYLPLVFIVPRVLTEIGGEFGLGSVQKCGILLELVVQGSFLWWAKLIQAPWILYRALAFGYKCDNTRKWLLVEWNKICTPEMARLLGIGCEQREKLCRLESSNITLRAALKSAKQEIDKLQQFGAAMHSLADIEPSEPVARCELETSEWSMAHLSASISKHASAGAMGDIVDLVKHAMQVIQSHEEYASQDTRTIETLLAKVRSLEVEKQAKNAKNQQLVVETSALSASLRHLQDKLAAADAEIVQMGETIQYLQQHIGDRCHDVTTIAEQLCRANNRAARLAATCWRLAGRLSAADRKQMIQARHLAGLSARLREVEIDSTERRRQIIQLACASKLRTEKLELQMNDLLASANENAQLLAEAMDKNTRLERAMEDLEQELDERCADASQLDREYQAALDQLNELESLSSAFESRHVAQEREISRLKTQVESLTKGCDDRDSQIDLLLATGQKQRTRVAMLLAEKEQLDKALAELKVTGQLAQSQDL
ncbi:hypothetical protein BCR44DRAFT_1518313 [Catenaria anguillulae PL171]|uniref:Uncharacterized protein n=1 Tax=Catenaria anguillulae PL171 TaxID=765915 RepID=A0A1Y2H7H3_9FUNG|nr:hypothetical protein BCR44DRAFT_1518313 [Catenaria anguillulae PL171]